MKDKEGWCSLILEEPTSARLTLTTIRIMLQNYASKRLPLKFPSLHRKKMELKDLKEQQTWSVPRGIVTASDMLPYASQLFWIKYNALTTCHSKEKAGKPKSKPLLNHELWIWVAFKAENLKATKLTRSKGRKNAEALDDLLPALRATALPWQSMTGEPLDPPFVPDAAYVRNEKEWQQTRR